MTAMTSVKDPRCITTSPRAVRRRRSAAGAAPRSGLRSAWLGVLLGALVACRFTAGAEAEKPRREFTAAERSHWSFQPVRRPSLPDVRSFDWSHNPLDLFVQAKLEAKGIAPGAEADRITLIRRLSLDLLGLPPTPEEVRSFVDDPGPDAYERLVDRLLASPQYGERWARHWLDLARFAESTGFEQDETRPHIWRYRDYVIEAFNRDLPYDQFVREQIAGDELWPDRWEARIATGFLRHYPEEGNNKDLLLARQEMLHHITDVVGSTFLGLTFNCAQCHDHKYDPILQSDYYRLQAFFANVGHDDQIPLAAADALRTYQEQLANYERQSESLWREMDGLLAKVRRYSPAQLLARYPDYVIQAQGLPANQRTPLQAQISYILEHKDCNTCPIKPKPYRDPFFANDAAKLSGEAKERYSQLKQQLEQLATQLPPEVPRASGMIDISATAPPTHVLGIGLYTSPKESVEPGFLSILDPTPAVVSAPEGRPTTGRRTVLAAWLTDARNPLTARVMVNRLWNHHFGRGIVGTPSDLGMVGDAPSHPELLDWLADELVQHGWSLKHIQRLIVTSATYRQSSYDRPTARELDPGNYRWWRFPPQRLDAEVLRDAALAVAGDLNLRMGGPSVFPPLPAGRPIPVGGWKVTANRHEHGRRSIYIFVRRNDRFPLLEAFDFPDSHESCPRRQTTTTALQALSWLNGEAIAGWSRDFAAAVLAQAGSDLERQLDVAAEMAYLRPLEYGERQAYRRFLEQHQELLRSERGLPAPTAAVVDSPAQREAARDALADFCLVLLNSNEFVYNY